MTQIDATQKPSTLREESERVYAEVKRDSNLQTIRQIDFSELPPILLQRIIDAIRDITKEIRA